MRSRYLQGAFLVLLTATAVSCSSLTSENAAVRFRDGAWANVVVRFYGWDSIQIMRPDVREDGFLPMLNRENVTEKLDQTIVQHDLAVVVFGYMHTNAEEVQLIRDWNTLLQERGFKRVVLLRAGFKDKIDGLPIVSDSAMSAAHDEPEKYAATLAALSAPVGANVAYPSGSPVR